MTPKDSEPPVSSFLDRFVHRRGAEVRDDRTAEFLRSINMIVSLEQLLERFCAHILERSGAGSVYVLLFEPITERYTGRLTKGGREEQLSGFSFARTEPLVRWLNVNQVPLDIRGDRDIVRFLAQSERDELERNGIALVVPLIALNRLSGMLLLSAPPGAQPYGREEIDILARLASQAAPSIEHALIAEQQEDSLKRILHADKLAIVGELAAGAAHEIRNPLTSIRSTVQYLQRDVAPEKQAYVQGIIEEVDRIDGIIKGLLSLSRTSDLTMSTVDLGTLLTTTLTLLDPEFRKRGIIVRREFPETGSDMEGDAAQLKQVFLNILMNALQATDEGGSVSVRIGTALPGMLTVTITDSGSGIPEAQLSKVFNPFFTTKESGTGLGLSISYGIVTRHGGDIELKSRCSGPDQGTTVVIQLPRSWRRKS
jgi:signal transduction histidine kinase